MGFIKKTIEVALQRENISHHWGPRKSIDSNVPFGYVSFLRVVPTQQLARWF